MNLLGTPETNRRGLKTRNALNALTSKPSIWRVDKIVLTTLENTISESLLLVLLLLHGIRGELPSFVAILAFEQKLSSSK